MATLNDPETADRWAKALRYRRAGMSLARIAAKLGYADASGARYAIVEGMKAIVREPAEEVRAMELERLDRLMLAIWPKATGKEPDYDATDRVLKIMDRRAKLLGLDSARSESGDLTRGMDFANDDGPAPTGA